MKRKIKKLTLSQLKKVIADADIFIEDMELPETKGELNGIPTQYEWRE